MPTAAIQLATARQAMLCHFRPRAPRSSRNATNSGANPASSLGAGGDALRGANAAQGTKHRHDRVDVGEDGDGSRWLPAPQADHRPSFIK